MKRKFMAAFQQTLWWKLIRLVCFSLQVVVFVPHLLHANETDFPALKQFDAVYEFSHGTRVEVHASADINKSVGMGLLILRKFKLSIDGKLVSPKKFDELLPKMVGIRFETTQVSREFYGDTPKSVKPLYTLSFDYHSDAFGRAYPAISSETRKKMTIEFDVSGIKKVIEDAK